MCRLIGSGSTEVPDYDESTGTFEDFDEPEGEVEPKRFFIQLGFTMGFSYLMQGMEADRPAPQDRVFMAQSGMGAGMLTGNAPAIVAGGGGVVFPEPGTASEANLTAWIPDSDSEDSIGALQNECPADGTRTGPSVYAGTGNPADLFPSSYCVRMRSTGFVPQTALRANIGYFFTPRIAASALFRMQFSAGEGSFAGILLGARGEYLLTEPQTKGFTASAFLGVTFGQIQAQPPADGSTDEAPFVVTGPLGVHIGSTLRYRFMPNFGVFVAPELDMQLPAVLFHVDGTLGLEAAF